MSTASSRARVSTRTVVILGTLAVLSVIADILLYGFGWSRHEIVVAVAIALRVEMLVILAIMLRARF